MLEVVPAPQVAIVEYNGLIDPVVFGTIGIIANLKGLRMRSPWHGPGKMIAEIRRRVGYWKWREREDGVQLQLQAY
ncbi:hypothetical protein Dda_0022 [Drechslerella dactyloides]|uniref:Uncharacterized protein n=1 Tax=Drechslerella dactyloides TaxID=74499 RepID=A0AAD6J3Z7_DREDA|nr:hypothetical protein Dda_0022 [Drechslerella dactyloides]